MQAAIDSIMSATLGQSTMDSSTGAPRFTIRSQTAFYDTGMPQSNTSITHAYTLMPFNSGIHTRITEGSIVFSARYIPKVPMYGLMTIGQFNAHLAELHKQFTKLVDARNGDAMDLKGFLDRKDADPEHELQMYHAFKKQSPDARLERFAQLAVKDVFYSQSIFGITQRWNYLGVVVSTQRSEDSIQSSYAAPVYNAAVVLGERAMVTNYWDEPDQETHVGSKLYLVLERSGPTGAFQFRPYVLPIDEPVRKREPKKKYFMVGTLTQSATRVPAPRAIQRALGQDGQQAAFEAAGSIELIGVQLGI